MRAAALTLLALWPCAAGPGPPPLRAFTVVRAADAADGELFAAMELAYLLGNLTDPAHRTPLRNSTDLSFAGMRAVLAVGWNATKALGIAGPHPVPSGNDGFMLWQNSSAGAFRRCPAGAVCVALTGGPTSQRGTLYAVYELLELLGIKFLAADETHMPRPAPTSLPPFGRVLRPQAQFRHRAVDDYGAAGSYESDSYRLFGRRARLVPGGYKTGFLGGPCKDDTLLDLIAPAVCLLIWRAPPSQTRRSSSTPRTARRW